MSRSWFFASRRATEGLADSLAATGAWPGAADVDGETGYRRVGASRREVPTFSLSKARSLSVHHYRANPMAKAIIDTFTSFCVGDSGLTATAANPDVQIVIDDFWDDPRNDLAALQELLLRDHMLLAETPLELMVGEQTGVTRFSYVDPESIEDVELEAGNPLWPSALILRGANGEPIRKTIARVDDYTGLRSGEFMFWRSWRALISDRRGWPFLAPILDWLEAYDQVLWNLVDRTALARYLVWDVTVDGGPDDIESFIKNRGGIHVPRSGTVEVHNPGVKWESKSAQVGAYEDTNTTKSLLTNVAAGAGLAKTWLAEPEDANRATSLTMAEPVRRRVGGVQNLWLANMAELTRFAVDQAVAHNRLPFEVPVGSEMGDVMTRASKTVKVSGPEIAAADAQVNAEILVRLTTSLTGLVHAKLLTPEAAKVAARKAWEDYVGVPYTADLDSEDADADNVADYIDDKTTEASRNR